MRNFILPLTILLVFSSCQNKVDSYTVQYKSMTKSIYASGTIKSEGQYQVFPKSSGVIREILVTEGSLVNKGSILMVIDNKVLDYNQELSSINARFSSVSNNRDKLEDLLQSIYIAEKKYKSDSLLWIKQRRLWDQGVGSQFEFEQKELAYENSKSNFKSLKYKYHQLINQLSLQEKQTIITNKISSSQSDDRLIRSQMDGKIYNILKEVGEMVSPQIPVAIVGSKDRFEIELSVDETDITKVQIGQIVFINMESYENQTFEAKITKINPIMNEGTKSFKVLAAFIRNPPILYPNLSIEANILLAKKEKALLIPILYLSENNEVRLKSGEMKKVKTGIKNFEMVEVIEGLKENDVVIKPISN